MPFDLPIASRALSDLIAMRQQQSTPEYQMGLEAKRLGLQEIRDKQAAMNALIDGISQTENVPAYMKSMARLDPGAYMKYAVERETMDKQLEALQSGNYTLAAVLGGDFTKAPSYMEDVTKKVTEAELPAQMTLEGKRQGAQTYRNLQDNWQNISPALVSESSNEKLTSKKTEKARRHYMRTGGGLPEGVTSTGPVSTRMSLEEEGKRKAYLTAIDVRTREKEQMRVKLERIRPILNVIKSEFDRLEPGEGLGGKLNALYKSMRSVLGEEEYAQYASYKDMSRSMAILTARGLGDVGNIAVAEAALNQKLFPQGTDTGAVGYNKIRIFNKLLDALLAEDQYAVRDIVSRDLKLSYVDKATGVAVNPEGGDTESETDTELTRERELFERNYGNLWGKE